METGDDRSREGGEKQPIIEIPHDVVNEQILVAAVLTDADVRRELVPKIPASLFIEESHFAVWQALRTLRDQRIEFSIPTLHQACSNKVELSYLEGLAKQYPNTVPNIEHHVSILRWDAVRAIAVRGPIADLMKTLRDPLAPRERVRSLAKQIGTAFDKVIDRRFMLDPVILAREHASKIANRAVWPYGIDGLDVDEKGRYRLVPGAEPGKLTSITGVSGASKSAIAAMIALAQARMRKRVLYGAWEMGSGPTLELLALMSLGWSRYDVSTGNLDAVRLDEFRERMERIGTYIRFFEAPFANDFTRRYGNDDAINELHRQIADSGAEISVLDLWERMIPDGSPDAERRALFRTQHLFGETNCHGILVCQQKLKDVENRNDKRPTRSTILGSQAWVDISDTILGLHRPGHWQPRKGDDVLQIFVLKQRFGRWPLAVEGDWDGDKCSLRHCRTIEYEAIGKSGEFADEFLGIENSRSKFNR